MIYVMSQFFSNYFLLAVLKRQVLNLDPQMNFRGAVVAVFAAGLAGSGGLELDMIFCDRGFSHFSIIGYNIRMDKILGAVGGVLSYYPALKFVLVAAAVVIHGETGIVLFIYFAGGSRFGWLSFFLTAFAALAIAETFTYFLGYFLRGTAFGRRIEGRIKNHGKIEEYLRRNSARLLILSKFVIYLSLGVVFLSGWTRAGYLRFLKLRLLAIFIWLTFMSLVIYGLIFVFGSLGSGAIFRRIETGTAIAVAIVLVAEFVFRGRIERGIMRNGKN